MQARARLIGAVGPRRAEDVVLDEVLDAARNLIRLEQLSKPIVVVVPSHSLRLHMMARLVERNGGSLLGVRCATHFALALGVVETLGLATPRGLDLFAILARRFARKEPSLVEALEHLRDGYRGILGAVRDLLDAGFQSAHLLGVDEALAGEGARVASASEIERARALIRVTARTLISFEELGIGRTSTLLQAATDGIRNSPDTALSAACVVLHGFADATGVTADFLEALLQGYGGLAVIDRPPDPVAPAAKDSNTHFTTRLEERLSSATESEERGQKAPPTRIELFRALGQEAEVREVAHRCLDLIDRGVRSESIGVVMRQPAPYVSLLRGVFDELALPFSGHGLTAPATAVGRRVRAFVDLVLQGSRTHVERWLDTLPERIEQTPLFDLRVALASLGISRLEGLASLDVTQLLRGDGTYPLPVRQGFFEADEEADGQQVVRTRRRSVPGTALRRLIAVAAALQSVLDQWQGSTLPLPEHLERLEEVMRALGWSRSVDEFREVDRIADAIRSAPPIAVEQEEFALTLRRIAHDAGRTEFAGQGAGVQVMGVVDARARTFEHLFVLGMNRGVFPRTVREDPVLSDALRKLLERSGHGLLPDLPIKRRGFQEERYLFAQLLSSSPQVTLSWLEMDDADRPAPASPLIERLRWCHPDRLESWRSPPLVGRTPVIDLDEQGRPRPERLLRLPPQQQALLAALYGRREALPKVLPAVLPTIMGNEDEIDYSVVATARLAILDEHDPLSAAAARSCLTPYLGFIGPIASQNDPRANRRLYVTMLERMATCPWQAFIERLLRVEAVPDPLDALPRIDALLVGILVHAVLERVVNSSISPAPRQLADLEAVLPRQVPWPEDDELGRLVAEEAERTVRSSGIALAGFAHALRAVARPYFEIARSMDWPDGVLSTLGAEIEGHLDIEIEGLAHRQIAFRADRVDSRGEGLMLTDYKTGTSRFTQKAPKTRYKSYLKEVRRGRRLQPVVYALAAGEGENFGRFAFVRPRFDGPDEARAVMVTSRDDEIREAFESALTTTLKAWEHGLFFPRLEEPGEPQKAPEACRWCRIAEACVRQDSGARRRLRVGMEHLYDASPGLEPEILESLLGHWWLPAPDARPESNG